MTEEQSNIWQCLKIQDLSCGFDWFTDNIIWTLLSLLFTLLIFKLVPQLWQALKITRIILKENRNTRGNSWGKYSADRFLDIWYSDEKTNPLPHLIGKFYEERFQCLNSQRHMDVIDKELEKMKLVKICDNRNGHAEMKPIRNWRNSLIAKITKSYLILFIGDDPQYYKNMLKRSNDK